MIIICIIKFKASNIFYFRDYTENDESSLLMNKYQALSELYDKMTQNKLNKRPESCQQILNDMNLWALMDNELDINKEFKEFSDNCDEEYKNNYVYKVIELLTRPDLRYNFDSNDSSKVFDISEESDSSEDSINPNIDSNSRNKFLCCKIC